MLQQGVGYTYTNNPRGASLVIDQMVLSAPNTPFRVYEDTNEEGQAILRIAIGTINNQLPDVNEAEIGTAEAYLPKPAGSGFVILQIPATEATGAPFPSATPMVIFSSSVSPNDEVTAYVALAKIDLEATAENPTPTMTISQLVTGSLWGERFECGDQLDYWFSQI